MGIKMKTRLLFIGVFLSLSVLLFGLSSLRADDAASGKNSAEVNLDAQKRISLDLKGVDLLELFRIISLKTGLTIVPSKSVSGRITLLLNNLTFEDALDVILTSQDLASEKRGDIINIMTAGEYQALYGKKYNERRKLETIKLQYAKPATVFSALGQLKSDIGKVIVDETTGTIILIDTPENLAQMKEAAANLDRIPETEVMDIKYAKPQDVKTQISGAMTSGPGEVYADDRSNKVVFTDLPEKMKKLRNIVKAFDSAPAEVFIEAEIVEITLNDQYQRGIDWAKLFKEGQDDLTVTGSFPASLTTYWKLAVGSMTNDHYNTVLQLLNTYGDTKILSRPRIAVINSQEAKILVGTREAYFTQTQSQAGTGTTVTSENVQYIDVGVKLNVTPMINKEGFVVMKIRPEVSTKTDTLTSSLGSKIPIVSTSEAETTVKVKDGATIMIAGLMKDEKRDTVTGLPGLARIPAIGWLFSNRDKQAKKSEIVVFITPHIITGESSFGVSEIKSSDPKAEAASGPLQYEASTVNLQEKLKGLKEY